jgi:hypothetical protein
MCLLQQFHIRFEELHYVRVSATKHSRFNGYSLFEKWFCQAKLPLPVIDHRETFSRIAQARMIGSELAHIDVKRLQRWLLSLPELPLPPERFSKLFQRLSKSRILRAKFLSLLHSQSPELLSV